MRLARQTAEAPTDTDLDMPLLAYVEVAESVGFETVLSTPFMRAQRLQVRGRSEPLRQVEEVLRVMARRDGFLLVLESYTGAAHGPVVNMAELNYRFRQGPHHVTVSDFGSLKIRLPEALADDERVYHAVVSGLGGAAPLDDGTMCVSAMEDVRSGLLAVMGRKDAYMDLCEERTMRIGSFLPQWPSGFLHTYGFSLARPCEAVVARHAEAPRQMAESRRLTMERIRLLPTWTRVMLGCGEDADLDAA